MKQRYFQSMARDKLLFVIRITALNLKSPENFGKFTEKEVSFFATLRKSLSQAARFEIVFHREDTIGSCKLTRYLTCYLSIYVSTYKIEYDIYNNIQY